MKCIILDLDGTLMPSHEVDNHCYWQAVHETYGLNEPTRTLSGFTHVTDNGILREWCEMHLGRRPSAAEVTAIKARFLALLMLSAKRDIGPFLPLPGVRRWLRQQPAGSVAIATGGWAHSARFKLKTAELTSIELPLRSADDALARQDIMRLAAKDLGADGLPPENITYIGDGPWDAAAALGLGWSFIGIAHGERADALLQAGAQRVESDFLSLL